MIYKMYAEVSNQYLWAERGLYIFCTDIFLQRNITELANALPTFRRENFRKREGVESKREEGVREGIEAEVGREVREGGRAVKVEVFAIGIQLTITDA